MKNRLLVLLFLTLILETSAQIPSCDGNRYKHPVFGSVDSIKDIQYGRNYTMNNVLQLLKMDVYEPEGDTVTKRPLIIFIHGGGFISGGKSDIRQLCIRFAYRGFVTATIDYRLIDVALVDSTVVVEGLVKAMSDAKAAVRFFTEDAAKGNIYKTDTNNIFISGLSAGGIIAAHVAFLDSTDNIPAYMLNLITENGGFAGNSSPDSTYMPKITGVINYSGALLRKDFISTGEPALFSVHDKGDTIVPCSHGTSHANFCPIFCDGSCAMQEEANFKGLYNGIFLNPSNGHLAYFYTMPLADTVIQRTADFLYGVVCNTIVEVSNKALPDDEIRVFPNPAENLIQVEFSDAQDKDDHMQLYSSIGVLLREVNAAPVMQIDLSDLPIGPYFIHLKNHPGQTRIFFKQ